MATYIGYINNIKYKNKDNRTIVFIDTTKNTQYNLQPINDFIGNNLLEHDRLSFQGEILQGTNNVLIMTSIPNIVAASDKEGIKTCFIKAIAKTGVFGAIRSDNLYSYFFEESMKTKITVEEYIDKESDNFKYKDSDIYYASQKVITGEQHKKLMQWWYKKRVLRPLYFIGLNNKDIRNAHLPPTVIYDLCKTNPLRIISLGLEKCITIFKHFGINPTENQLQEGLIARSLLSKLTDKGWISTPCHIILKEFPDFNQHFQALMNDYGVNLAFNSIYLPYPYKMEQYIYKRLAAIHNTEKIMEIEDIKPKGFTCEVNPNFEKTLDDDKNFNPNPNPNILNLNIINNDSNNNNKDSNFDIPPNKIPKDFTLKPTDFSPDFNPNYNKYNILKREEFKKPPLVFKNQYLDDIQQKAITTAIYENISIISGGAGTGKSTIIKEIAFQLEKMHFKWIACSFTGKAVQRIKEIIKPEPVKTSDKKEGFYPIQTMHRFIYSNDIRNYLFEYLIIDEISMVSEPLFYDFLKCFEKHFFKIIFVGDINQLEPIEYGNLYEQILKANCFANIKLEKNYRVSVDGKLDGIVENANKIVDYIPSDDPYESSLQFRQCSNFYLLDENYERIIDLVKTFYKMNKPDTDFIVICPYNKYVDKLNQDIQNIYRDDSLSNNRFIQDKDNIKWVFGDRIALKKNLIGVGFNGLGGRIIDIGYDEKLNDHYVGVLLKDNTQEYKFYLTVPKDEQEDDDEDGMTDALKAPGDKLYIKYLRHSYSETVHMCQGSEINNVILYIPESAQTEKGSFLNKNLMYTAITRAKLLVIVVGNISTFYSGCTKKPFIKYNNLHLQFKALSGGKNNNVEEMLDTMNL